MEAIFMGEKVFCDAARATFFCAAAQGKALPARPASPM
jgi:hypothetical protein